MLSGVEEVAARGPQSVGLRSRKLHTADGDIFILELSETKAPSADVVIIPPYGKSAHELVMIAHQLSRNGFNVIRFDPRNHVGRGSGTILDFRLSQVEADTERVLDARTHPERAVLLVALSLSAPVAWKVAQRRPEVTAVVSLVGVVDVTYTVEQLLPERSLDCFRVPGVREDTTTTIFGYQVRAVSFTRDIDQYGYRTLEDSIDVVRSLQTPAHMIVADQDEYVRLCDVERFRQALSPGSEFVLMKGLTHEIGRSLRAARVAIRTLTSLCRRSVRLDADVVQPPLTELISSSAVESEFLAQFDARNIDGGTT